MGEFLGYNQALKQPTASSCLGLHCGRNCLVNKTKIIRTCLLLMIEVQYRLFGHTDGHFYWRVLQTTIGRVRSFIRAFQS